MGKKCISSKDCDKTANFSQKNGLKNANFLKFKKHKFCQRNLTKYT